MNILYSTCFLGHPNKDPARVERLDKWLDYHLKLKEQLGFDKIVFVDNASYPLDLIKYDMTMFDANGNGLSYIGKTDIIVYRFRDYLPRTGIWEYPYYWRALNKLKDIIMFDESINKVVHVDTDFYILKPNLADYIKNLNSGWTTLYCNKYKIPESAIWVLNKDAFPTFLNFPIPSYTHYNGKMAEEILPFTAVNKSFIGDRYGETLEKQTKDMDYYGQWQVGCPDMVYEL